MIAQWQVRAIARGLGKKVDEYMQDPEHKKEFEEWKKKRECLKEES